MKKKEIMFLLVLTAAAVMAVIWIKAGKTTDHVLVEIRHYTSSSEYTVLQEFDPSVDAVYHVEGDSGGLEVEVLDGRWHVINAVCPNHDCEEMGWAKPGELMPITCLPNQIIVIEKTK